MDPVALLASTRLFRGQRPEDLEPLRPHVRLRTYARGSYLFHEGDAGTHLFAVATGEVKISRTRRLGEEAVFAILREGDLFGELALFNQDAERTADAQAVEPTECVTLRREPLLAFMRERPDLLLTALSVLSEAIRQKDETVAEIAFLDIPGRVARLLLDLAERHGRTQDGSTRIDLKLSQRTLAGMVYASRENVNRALARFAHQGDIRLEGGTITILRPEALRRRSG